MRNFVGFIGITVIMQERHLVAILVAVTIVVIVVSASITTLRVRHVVSTMLMVVTPG